MKHSLLRLVVCPLLALFFCNLGLAQNTSTQARIDLIKARLEKIQQRSTEVGDINELENLQHIYGYYTDKQLWDEVAGLFTEDATLEIGTSGEKVGKASIREYLYSLSNNQQGPIEGAMYNHFQLQPVITLSEDGLSASGRWRTFMQLGSYGDGSGGQWGEGPYENEYVKEGGVWKIKKLHWYATFIGPYEGGWAQASKELVDRYSKGDALTSEEESDYTFPNVSRPGFHYSNPVTGD